MFDQPSQSRRAFLRRSGQLAMTGTALPFALNLAAMGEAAAFTSTPGDYKALVCVFMYGGNDYANTVVPYDSASYAMYNSIRGGSGLAAGGIALGFNALTPTLLNPTVVPTDLLGAPRQYALHPAMTGLADLFNNSGKMAVQLNVGPLVEPISRAEYEANTKRRPPQLFSHNDQQSLWQSSNPEGAKHGWGGSAGDLVLQNAVNTGASSVFTCMSVSGNTVLLSGQTALQYQVSSNGAISISPAISPYGSTAVGTALKGLIRQTSSAHKFENEYNAITARALDAEAAIKAALASAPANGLGVTFPTDGLGRQLQMVARLIKARAALGSPGRQVFFVSIGGFDLHNDLIAQHPVILGSVSAGMKAFYDATVAMGTANNVTTFTASDFGRTLASNADGSDHGWGSHHFVVGGAVKGKAFYGMPPPVSVTSRKVAGVYMDEDKWHVGEGRLLPSTSVDQYAATLAKWFGVSDTEMPGILQNIDNFGVTRNGINYTKDMGFMA